ncbi:hypothetical protein Celaphus_00010048 [Cervus elaphus hippelaphus]|uniref:MAGE domain-containing protein n=1 Tax=Cervus elaphus hippelaphus TaxID=46360 RepID=A0A212BZV5_CEREH|nr:hypothetical protein Celaphus_00010048 [Cervus elaphus hippelaphus]
MEVVFGLELKEVDCSRNIYALINKFSVGGDKGLSDGGLLMALLGVTFMKGNRTMEEEVWEFLSVLGVCAGRRHWIFGEPRRLITKDLVQKEYLNYHEGFLRGPRTYAETSKTKVLEVLAKIQDTTSIRRSERSERSVGESRAERRGQDPNHGEAKDNSQSSSATGSNSTSQGSSKAPSTTNTFSSTSDTRSDEEDTSQDEEDSCSSNVSSSTETTYSDILNSTVSLLEQLLLYKYKMKQPIMKEDMLKIIHPRYHDRFAEILKRASEHIEAVFAVDLKEVDSTIHSYDPVSKLKLPNNGRVWDGRG